MKQEQTEESRNAHTPPIVSFVNYSDGGFLAESVVSEKISILTYAKMG